MKKWVTRKLNKDNAVAISQRYDLPMLIAMLLDIRGITQEDEIVDFLSNETLTASPFEIKDMDKAVERIQAAIEEGERICVYGDFDADGVTSTALLYSYLSDIGADAMYYIPSRETEGYGMHRESTDRLYERGVKLIITVDNGISAIGEAKAIREMGMELVVSQRLQLVVGLSPLQAGLTILPIPLGAFIAGPLAGLALPRIGAERILSTSLALSAAGALLYLLGYGAEQWVQILSFSLLGFGVGAAMTAASSAMLLHAPPDRAGMAASIEEVSYELGGALGIAILGSVMSAVYTAAFITPAGMQAPALARDSLDGALIVAETLPDAIAIPLISLAKGAFEGAFVTVMIVVVALLAVASAGVALSTRRKQLP